jgi:hypothetical protein
MYDMPETAAQKIGKEVIQFGGESAVRDRAFFAIAKKKMPALNGRRHLFRSCRNSRASRVRFKAQLEKG